MVGEVSKVVEGMDNASLRLFQNKVNYLKDINSIIVHNLRGTASNIKMLVQMLQKIYVYKDDESSRRAQTFSLEQGLLFIEESSSSLLAILSDLMKGLEPGKGASLEYEQCDVAGMICDTSLQLNGFILEKEARIVPQLDVPFINYPKCYLESLLYNFISNALKYSRPGVPVEVLVATYLEDGKTVLSVSDNGLGIDLEKYGDKIFNFNQVFHEGYDSKGIGLYISRKQMESLGGTISVKSKVNEGSEFVVTF